LLHTVAWLPDASAQIYDEYKSLGDNMALNRSMEAVTAAGVMNSQIRLGTMKIQSGRATTHIAASATASVVPKLPASEQAAARELLAAFHRRMSANRLSEYDIAHGFAQAFVLAFEAYTGTEPGGARLALLAKDLKSVMLKDPFSQGEQLASQQRQYENMALQSMRAIAARRAGKVELAKQLGAPVISRLWSKPVQNIELTAIGFGDRGERLIGQGNTASTYVRTSDRNAVHSRLSAFATDPSYLAQLPARFDAEVRRLGWSPDNPDDAITAAFILVARAQKVSGAETPAFAARARKFIADDVKTNTAWVGMDDKSKQDRIEFSAFLGLILIDQQATVNPAHNWGQFASAANYHLRYAFRKDFLDHMGIPTIF
jgi:hypothetical protein